VLVNNAGFGTFGNFWETDVARDRALINLNIMTPMLLTKLFLPGMVRRKRGRILNVGSVSGFLASPYASTYYSSKAFLLSFSQGVATSLRGSGVTVTIVCPGPTYTAFDWHSTEDGGAPPQRKRFQMDAADVAAQAYRGMRRGRWWSSRCFQQGLGAPCQVFTSSSRAQAAHPGTEKSELN
jgi:short-subunit dehydrogenase